VPTEPISDDHHVLRVCKGTNLRPEDRSPGPGAFICNDLDGISCNWLEYFQGDLASRLSQVRAIVAARRTVRSTHVFAMLNVGTARARALEVMSLALSVLKDPLPPEGGKPEDPSHALIEQVAEAAREALGGVLASCVCHTASAKGP